jgi:hypothetical protein
VQEKEIVGDLLAALAQPLDVLLLAVDDHDVIARH